MTKEQALINYLEWFIPQQIRQVDPIGNIGYREGINKPIYVRIYIGVDALNKRDMYVFNQMVDEVHKYFPCTWPIEIRMIIETIVSSIEISYK